MPPRRSTRSASVQPPQSATLPAANKRKRAQPKDEEEQENIKPTTKSRKPSTSSVNPRSRASTRSTQTLDDVKESDEEDDAPPVKKSRPSIEADQSDEEEDIKPVRGTRASSRRPPPSAASSSSRNGVKVKVEVVLDPPLRSRRSSRTPSVHPSARPTRRVDSAKKSVPDIKEDEEEEEEGAEEEVPKPKPKPSSRRKAAARIVEENEDEDDDPPQSRSSRRSTSVRTPAAPTSSSRAKAKTHQVKPIPEDDEGEPSTSARHSKISQASVERTADPPSDDEIPESSGHKVSQPAQHPEPDEEEEEEEHSLLDIIQPLAPNPSSQTQPTIPEEPEGPKPRLVIHKMALINFKSYAGRQEIGPFHKSFSAIVGPNGSGKSNTIDALLFVFGYRASKMRQGKLSELIHNSARYPDLDECSVEVHFKEIIDLPGANEYEDVPNSTLVVSRTAYKNNTSRYTVNGQQRTYKEVQALLKGKGIDLDHNRFLILQGEVESIAQMKPKAPSEHEDGLLEYLEDIIGTSQYKQPIEEALSQMDQLNEDRAHKMNRLKIVERERAALEKEKKEAEDFLRLQNDFIRARSRLYQWYLWKALQNEERYAEKIAEKESELKEVTEQNQGDITHLAMLEKHYKERGEAYEEVKEAAAEALKDLTSHEKKQVGLEERRKHANTKVKKLKKSLQDDERARTEAIRAFEDNTRKIETEKANVDQLEESLAKEEKALEVIRDSLKDKTQVFHDQIEVKQKELEPWTAKINSKQAEIDVATSERDTLEKKVEGIKEAFKEAKTSLEKLREGHQDKVSELDKLKEERTTKHQEFKVGQRRLQELRDRVQDLRSKASSSRQKADEAKASQAANTSQNKVLEGLTRLKNAGRINGFHGRLGSLGTIPDKYDVAVSTACGMLNHMVVDTVEQGQACIDYLRKQNLGRASFLVLSELNKNKPNMAAIQTPGNVPRLFDLIKPKEPRFAVAFFKGVSNTLVADNLDQANRIAFGGQRRWRVVTLAGQLIDASGTMSGGGNHVARGGMSSKLAAEAVSPEVLRRYEQDSEQASRELEEVLNRLRDMEGEVESLAKAGPRIDIAIEKASLDVQNGARRVADAEKRVRDLSAQSKPDAGDLARIASLEKVVTASTEELNKLEQRTSSIQDDIKKLEKKIIEAGGSRLLGQKSKVEGIHLHINLANDNITKAEVARAKAEKDSAKIEHTLKTNTNTLEELEVELDGLNKDLEECREYVEEIRSQVEAAQTAAENSKEDLDGLKQELDEKTDEIQEFRLKEATLKQKLADLKKEAAENTQHIDHWQREHDKLRLQDIDDDDEDEDEDEESKEDADPSPQPVKAEPRDPGLRKKGRHDPHELHMYTDDELSKLKKQNLMADVELLDEKVKASKPNLSVLKDYRKREEEFLRRAHDLEEVTKMRDAQKQEYERLTKQRLDEFMVGFNSISLNLRLMYQTITLSGNAELELVDSMDPFSEGIIFSVMPPKKSWRNISNLSGGEKTLSSLALVFALHVYKPTPLYFMDEIDAALDFRNVSIVANYIKDRTKNAQFIIISLRNDMFELSHRLIGIYKTANATRSISIDNHSLHVPPTLSVARA